MAGGVAGPAGSVILVEEAMIVNCDGEVSTILLSSAGREKANLAELSIRKTPDPEGQERRELNLTFKV